MSTLNINVADLPVSENNFEPLPAGWYSAEVSGAEVRKTKTGGEMIALKYTINGPTHSGRIIFGNLNIKNSSPTAERIGRQQLGDLMRAIGLSKVTDADQLIGASLSIKLKVRPAKDGYDASNDVSGYKAGEGGIPAMKKSEDSPFGSGGGGAKSASPPWVKK